MVYTKYRQNQIEKKMETKWRQRIVPHGYLGILSRNSKFQSTLLQGYLGTLSRNVIKSKIAVNSKFCILQNTISLFLLG